MAVLGRALQSFARSENSAWQLSQSSSLEDTLSSLWHQLHCSAQWLGNHTDQTLPHSCDDAAGRLPHIVGSSYSLNGLIYYTCYGAEETETESSQTLR